MKLYKVISVEHLVFGYENYRFGVYSHGVFQTREKTIDTINSFVLTENKVDFRYKEDISRFKNDLEELKEKNKDKLFISVSDGEITFEIIECELDEVINHEVEYY